MTALKFFQPGITKEKVEEEINWLVDTLMAARHCYYNLSTPVLSDIHFDSLEKELFELCRYHGITNDYLGQVGCPPEVSRNIAIKAEVMIRFRNECNASLAKEGKHWNASGYLGPDIDIT